MQQNGNDLAEIWQSKKSVKKLKIFAASHAAVEFQREQLLCHISFDCADCTRQKLLIQTGPDDIGNDMTTRGGNLTAAE